MELYVGGPVRAALHTWTKQDRAEWRLLLDQTLLCGHCQGAQLWCCQREYRGQILAACLCRRRSPRSEEPTSELHPLMRISYAVFCLKKKKQKHTPLHNDTSVATVFNNK